MRFRSDPAGAADLADRLHDALGRLAAQRGFVTGHVGRNVDDPTLWVLSTTWTGAGTYRRALSAYDVKVHAWPTLGQALDEPTAYQLVQQGEAPDQPGTRGEIP